MAERTPNIRAEVDLMILDYLVCLAVSRLLAVVGNSHMFSDVEWLVQSVETFHSIIEGHQLEYALPSDLDLKLQIFHIVNSYCRYTPPSDCRHLLNFTPLSHIAVEFMQFCYASIEHVSRTRWFDLGAHIMAHAILEEKDRFPEPLRRLCSWTTDDDELNAYWEVSCGMFLEHIPPPYGTAAPASREELDRIFDVQLLHDRFTGFVEDLMEVLDAPLLVQLEQGQLIGLTREETQRVIEACRF
ncbi:hypothetical protein PENANT_c003G09149 [Penicillium antarcticum]|uniref:Uncharacterized protein n=1 Tax=Penicillium antarcticum TaxID=416450 RepID=A0A1V6QHS8_9EURO|nr:uncharacterized protein N7508_005662 [Penicillium antarcticum]KAJ5306647.1 hypothetical protein N7508_005662 [Penicillium antarcticum]OQD88781.1 hypothetical protein PENANT_c003G09149 [Penicillium antarcticum]